MKSKMMFIAAALLVMLMAGAVHAKPDGSFGTDCASCHANGIPGGTPNTPPVDPPAPPPTDTPGTPPADTPGTPPADGGTEQPGEPPGDPPPYVASDHILSLELGTVWHYGSLDTPDDLKYVFYAAVETDTSVNRVDVITPKGNRLQITSEPGTEVDNVKTWFGEADGVRVWEYEATFGDARELDGYGKGDYTVEVHHDGGIAEEEDQPSKGADKDPGGQKPDKNKPDKNVTDDEQKNDGYDKKTNDKSKKKSHKPKKSKDNDDEEDEEE